MNTQTPIPPAPSLPDEPYYRERPGGNGREQTRRWGTILIILGVIWLVFTVASRGGLFGFGMDERSVALPAQSFSAARVEIIGLNDRVELVGWSDDVVQVEATRHGFGWNRAAAEEALERLEIVTELDGDLLRVEVRRPAGLSGLVGPEPYASLRIALPADVGFSAETANGDITAEGLSTGGRLATINGDISVENLQGDLRVETTNGDVSLEGFRGALTANSINGDIAAEGEIATAEVETVSGDVELRGAGGALRVSTISGAVLIEDAAGALLNIESTNGDISFAGDLAPGQSRISNISGDVELALSPADDLRLLATTVSGDLENDLDARDIQQDRRRLSLTLGDGSAALEVSTTSGDLSVSED